MIYNRLHNRMPLGIDATLRYGLDIPPTESITKSALRARRRTTRACIPGLPPTPIANPGLASIAGGRAPGEGRLPLLRRASPTPHHFFTASESEFLRRVCEYGYGCDDVERCRRSRRRHDALLGHSVAVAHSLSPRMQNAAFAALGLDWALRAAADVAERSATRSRGARARSASPART